MALTPKDVLQALASFKTPDGIAPLKAGYVQDVAVEPHQDGPHVNIHVEDTWRGTRVTDADREALSQFIHRRFPEVVTTRVIPRTKTQADTARKFAKPGQAVPRTPVGAHLIAIISGKGGVGKSTVSINLAHALTRLGYRTGVLDCDIYGFSVPDLLGLADPVKTREGLFIPPRVRDLDVMSMKFFVEPHAPVMWRGPMLGKAIRQMMEQTLWNAPEYLVLDLPPGTGDVAMDVHEYFPQAACVVVTTPDANAARVAARAGQMARNMNRRLLGVVENLSAMGCPECGHLWYPLGHGGAAMVAESLNIPVLAQIPWVIVGESGVSGLIPEEHAAAEIYQTLAARLAILFAESNEAHD